MSFIVQAVILLAASVMAVQSVAYLKPPIVTSPGILPLLISVAAALMAGALMVADLARGTVRPRAMAELWRNPQTRRTALRTSAWLALATGYAVLTPVIGFTWATLAFLLVALRMFGELAWWRVAAIAVPVAVVVPLVFRHVFFTIVP